MVFKRERIGTMIDAPVWMRREEARLNRLFTLDGVSDQLLSEYGLRRLGAVATNYRYTDRQAMLMPVAEIIAPVRKLNPGALRSIVRGVRGGIDLPPVVVFCEPGAGARALLDVLYRLPVSRALGFALIQPTESNRENAGLVYCYRRK